MRTLRKSVIVMLGVLLAATLTVVGLAHAQTTDEGSSISEEAAMNFADQFDAIFDGPNLDIADEILSPDFVSHLPLAPELDREGWKNYVASLYTGVSDLT